MEKQTQLAVIMFTDIVGYTRLMGTSEEKALGVLQQNRAVQKPLITKFNGRFIKELGDGTMASFNKASDAVRCAMEIQKASAEFPDLNLRIGIHMGEVLFEDGDVFGDTVNIAARIESAGKPGAVFISGAVYGAVHNKTDVEAHFVEQMQLKNVNRPIDIYEVGVDGNFQSKSSPKNSQSNKQVKIQKPALIGIALLVIVSAILWFVFNNEGSPQKLDNASIAVLPFKNMSSDADNEFFCDGVTEDLLTQLSKLKSLKVISRTSVMHFKNSELSIPEIAKELGVEYIVEGSVRKQGNQVAITAQLIHAEDDGHIWAENYQRNLDDVFAIQQEVATEIASRLNVEISSSEQQGLKQSETENLEAYQLCLKGKEAADDRSETGIRRSISLLQQAVDLDPNYVTAKAELAYSILLLDWYVYDREADSLQNKAERILNQAMRQDSTNANIYISLYDLYSRIPKSDPSRMSKLKWAAERAVAHGPNNAYAYFKKYQSLSVAGEYQEALLAQTKALELDPFSAIINGNYVGALRNAGKIKEARNYFDTHKHLNIANSTIAKEYYRFVRSAMERQQWDVAIEITRDLIAYEQTENLYSNYLYWTAKAAVAIDPNPDIYIDVFKHYVVTNGIGITDYVYALFKADRLQEAKEILDTGFYAEKASKEDIKVGQFAISYVSRDFKQAEKVLRELDPQSKDYAYCLTQLGRQGEVLTMINKGLDSTWSDYDNATIYASLGETERALEYFEKVEDVNLIALSRIDWDIKPLWTEPRYQAKVAAYNFPPLKGEK